MLALIALGFAALSVPGTGPVELPEAGGGSAGSPGGLGPVTPPRPERVDPSERPVNLALVSQSLGQVRNAPKPVEVETADPIAEPEPDPNEPPPSFADAAVAPDSARFLGTMRSRNGWRAVLVINETQRLVRVGDEIDGFEVSAIDAESITFEGPRGTGRLGRAPVNRSDSNLSTAAVRPDPGAGRRGRAAEVDADAQRRIDEMRERREQLLRERRERRESAGET